MERAADRAHSVLPSAEFVNEETIVFRSTHDMAIKALRKEIDNVYNAQPDEIKKNRKWPLPKTAFVSYQRRDLLTIQMCFVPTTRSF